MFDNFRAVSLSYKNAPLAIRELISIDETQIQQLAKQLKSWEHISDVLILSTCNRTEVYYASADDLNETIIQSILSLKNLAYLEFASYFHRISEHERAIEHLFNVSIGLESQVVGDLQIPNQVKVAYQLSADFNLAGPFLHRLMHTIFFTNKKVVQETPFRSGTASSSYATVELIEHLASQIANPKVLVLGIGEIGKDVCKNLKDSAIRNVTIMNRTLEKAKELALECNFTYMPISQLNEEIAKADIVVSSIRSPKPFITRQNLNPEEIISFKYLIDLSVPRSIEEELSQFAGIVLYNIDQIQNKVNDALQKRLASIPDVKAIIAESVVEFLNWSKEMEISPTLQKLKNALEQIRQEELARYAKKLNDVEIQRIEQITKNIMQKIIKLPALQLKAACKRGDADSLIEVLNDLFDLEKQKSTKLKIK